MFITIADTFIEEWGMPFISFRIYNQNQRYSKMLGIPVLSMQEELKKFSFSLTNAYRVILLNDQDLILNNLYFFL